MNLKLSVGSVLVAFLLTACGGGGSDFTIDFWSDSGLVVADFNRDGRDDIAVITQHINRPPPHEAFVKLFLQTPAGTMSQPRMYEVTDPWSLTAFDLNGDGRQDLIATATMVGPAQINTPSDSGLVSLLYADPANPGSFLASVQVPTGGVPSVTVVGRLAGDAAPDLVQNGPGGTVRIFPRNTAGAFGPRLDLSLPSGESSRHVAVADLDRDGRDDIAVISAANVHVFRQRAAGNFAPAQRIGGGGIAFSSVLVADLDRDGRPDIVVGDEGNAQAGQLGGSAVMIFMQLPDGTFSTSRIALPDGAQQVVAGDLDGDGMLDLAVISLFFQSASAWHGVTVLRQSAVQPGAFSAAGLYEGPFNGAFVAIGDVNGDGRNDIVINDGPGVLLQSTAQPGAFTPYRPF